MYYGRHPCSVVPLPNHPGLHLLQCDLLTLISDMTYSFSSTLLIGHLSLPIREILQFSEEEKLELSILIDLIV